MEELVSVIIPVYNVERYLKRCIDSVTNQTYTTMEIILVNDGSNDKSGEICDSYAQNDSRIKVIHKSNGGLSDARNAGIDISTGKYITFVDSDDWVRKDYIELLVMAIQYGRNQISACAYVKTDNDGNSDVDKKIDVYKDIETWTIDDAYRHMFLHKKIDQSAWAKLYNRSLFNGIRFPFGKIYEDMFITYKLFHVAQAVSYIDQKLYYYFDRPGSILNETFTIRKMDELEAAMECVDFIDVKYPHLHEVAVCRLVSSCFHMLFAINNEKEWKKETKELKKIIRENRNRMIVGKDVNRKVRIGCICSYLGFRTAKWIYRKSGVRGKINI